MSLIEKQINNAASKKAHIVHFSECNLCGYGGYDFNDYSDQQTDLIRQSIAKVRQLAKQKNLYIILGTHFHERSDQKPFNSLIVIDRNGEISHRYDKRLLAGDPGELDRKYYSKGHSPVIFQVNGIKCGLLICHEWRYPELYREYKKLGVDIVFQSWYDANLTDKEYRHEGRTQGELVVGSVRGYAANNYIWISGSNNSSKESCFASFVVRPDGIIENKLKRNVASVLITRIDFGRKFEDLSYHNRTTILEKG